MDTERKGMIIACAVALLAIFAVGTGSITGNFGANSAGAYPGAANAANFAVGLAVILVFIIAAISVLKTLIPEGRFHQ